MADDEPDIFKIVKVRLVKQGYDVLLADNGREAVELAGAYQPDLIIMDYLMPVMNGLEAVTRLRNTADLKHIPIILMSASSNSITEELLADSKINAFIPKPFDAAELMKVITQLLK